MEVIEKVLTRLDNLNIDYQLIKHKPVYTIDEINQINEIDISFVLKNLFLTDDKKQHYYLVLLKNDQQLDLKKLRKVLKSRRLTFASEEDLNKYLGLKKGAVSPLGILNDHDKIVDVIIDKEIEKMIKIGIHPNINTATIYLSFTDLLKVIESNGNRYRFIELNDNSI